MVKLTIRYSSVYDQKIYLFVNGEQKAEREYFAQRKKRVNQIIPSIVMELEQKYPAIVELISQQLGLPWHTEEIVVYIIPNWHKKMKLMAFSDPITVILDKWEGYIATPHSLEIVLYNILHELCHHIQRPLSKTRYYEKLKNEYKMGNKITLNHILTFALLKKVLKLEEYYTFTKIHHKNEKYMAALEIVERTGEEEIIAKSKQK